MSLFATVIIGEFSSWLWPLMDLTCPLRTFTRISSPTRCNKSLWSICTHILAFGLLIMHAIFTIIKVTKLFILDLLWDTINVSQLFEKRSRVYNLSFRRIFIFSNRFTKSWKSLKGFATDYHSLNFKFTGLLITKALFWAFSLSYISFNFLHKTSASTLCLIKG